MGQSEFNTVGYQSLTVDATSGGVALTVPTGGRSYVGILQDGQIRFRTDGTAPTTTEGKLVVIGQEIRLSESQMATARFLRTTGTSGTLKGEFFDIPITQVP